MELGILDLEACGYFLPSSWREYLTLVREPCADLYFFVMIRLFVCILNAEYRVSSNIRRIVLIEQAKNLISLLSGSREKRGGYITHSAQLAWPNASGTPDTTLMHGHMPMIYFA